jgi:hypothetical protein
MNWQVCHHLLTLLPTLLFILHLRFDLQICHHNGNLYLNQLLNGWWWLPRAELWGIYGWDTTTRPYISIYSHRDTINPIHIGSNSCSNLEPQLWIVFWMGWRILLMFGMHFSVILFLRKEDSRLSIKKY